MSTSFPTVSDCLPTDSPEERKLMDQARAIVHDRGAPSVFEELSRPFIRNISPELLPYVALVLLGSSEHTFPIEKTSPTPLPPGVHDPLTIGKAAQWEVLKSNCATIDDLLGGGIPLGTGAIFEISGQAGVGKTQLAMQLALMSAVPRAHGGVELPSIYVCTEGRPPAMRMADIDAALTTQFSLSRNALMHRVIVEQIESADALLQWAQTRLAFLLRQTGARVLILDSITAVYRPDFNDAISRAPHLTQTVAALREALTGVSGVCICVNQVSQVLDSFKTLNTTAPALGAPWSNSVATRIFLSRRRGNPRRYAKILHSSFLPSSDNVGEPYVITKDGIMAD